MRFMQQINIGPRLALAFSTLIVLSLLSGLVLHYQLSKLQKLNEKLYEHPLVVSNAARDIMVNTLAMHRSMKDVALANSPAEITQAIVEVDRNETEAYSHFDKIFNRYLGPPRDIDYAFTLFSSWAPIRNEVIELMRNGHPGLAEGITKGRGLKHINLLFAELEKMQAFAQNKADALREEVNKTSQIIQRQMFLLLALATFVGLLLAFAVQHSITAPLSRMVEAIGNIAKGDPTQLIEVHGNDEISSLALSFRQVQSTIQETIAAAHRIAQRDFSRAISIHGDRDLLGKAIDNMEKSLQGALADLRKKNEDLKEKSNDLVRMGESKNIFLANMSHELRTPLNGIMGMLQIIDTSRLSVKEQTYIETALHSCQRLTTLLGDILDLSKIEAGRLDLINEPFSLCETMSSLELLFQPTATQAGLDFAVTCPDTIPDKISGDEHRLRQVLFNLVVNAIKYTPKGHVALSVTELPKTLLAQRHLLFCVEDTGIGIKDEMITKIFDPFTQQQPTYSRQYQGAGLGLNIAKRLISLMGATLAVDSTLDKGTTIYLCVPFKTMELRPAKPSSRVIESIHERGDLKALLVEDDAVSRMAMQRLMELQGMTVQTAQDGDQALERLRNDRFDLILMDIQLPGQSGLDVTHKIRNAPEFAHIAKIPIIALTAYAMTGDKETFLQSGMDGYLAKPVSKENFIAAINKLILSP